MFLYLLDKSTGTVVAGSGAAWPKKGAGDTGVPHVPYKNEGERAPGGSRR